MIIHLSSPIGKKNNSNCHFRLPEWHQLFRDNRKNLDNRPNFSATTHTPSSADLSSRRRKTKVNRELNAPRLEHPAVWAEGINETAEFLQDALGWRRHPIEFGVDKDNEVFGGMNLAFVDANGFWLELVQPTTEGPAMDFLKEKGNGSLVELGFEIDDFDKNLESMTARGFDLIGMDQWQ
jgi:hypothetical protein